MTESELDVLIIQLILEFVLQFACFRRRVTHSPGPMIRFDLIPARDNNVFCPIDIPLNEFNSRQIM